MRPPNDPGNSPHEADAPRGVRLAPGVFIDEGVITVSAARSGGPGGQNVNMRSTKVELRLPLNALPISPAALGRLRRLAGRRITLEDELIITAEDERTQGRNRDLAFERLAELVQRALVEPKRRIKTKPTAGSKRRRIEGKKRTGDVKRARRRPSSDE